MNKSHRICVAAAATVAALCAAGLAQAQQANMTFFVTSAGSGKGADLGGLEGADTICQALAQAAGAGGKTWRAYLSTQGAEWRQCPRPHRQGTVDECQGCGRREGRRRAARRRTT